MTKTGTGNWQLRDSERIVTGNEALLGRKHLLVGMTRVRNEALILPDTLDYLAHHVDAIVLTTMRAPMRRWRFFGAIRRSR